jgi:hypothetical protein
MNPMIELEELAAPYADRDLLDVLDEPYQYHGKRDDLTKSHSWAIPNEEALQTIAEHSPDGLVDMGAGTGYWSYLLRERGVVVRPYDIKPGWNHYSNGLWIPVSRGGPLKLRHKLAKYGTLLLVWPPYSDPFAAQCLKLFQGHTVCYVGEGFGGCCADDEFFSLLHGKHYDEEFSLVETESEWEQVCRVNIPQWPGMHDYLSVWKRRSDEG